MTLLYADTRAVLSAEHPNRYVFGDVAAPLLVLNTADAYGCAWLCDTPAGWDAAPINTPVDRRQDGHGGILGESFFEERLLRFADGLVTAPTAAALADARDRWWATVTAALSGYVLYTHADEPGGPWSLWLRPTGTPRFAPLDDRAAAFSMDFIADDPLKFGPTAAYGPARLPTGTGDPGRTYAKVYPYSYGGSAARRDALTITNTPAAAGGDWAQAVYTVTGPVPTPRVTLSTGQWFELNATLGALDTAVLDTAAGTVQINGTNRPDTLTYGSVFPLIPPGGCEVRLRSTSGGTDPAAGLTVTTAPRRK
jgi:hypothetical protein